jgi:hypothetical protein
MYIHQKLKTYQYISTCQCVMSQSVIHIQSDIHTLYYEYMYDVTIQEKRSIPYPSAKPWG